MCFVCFSFQLSVVQILLCKKGYEKVRKINVKFVVTHPFGFLNNVSIQKRLQELYHKTKHIN